MYNRRITFLLVLSICFLFGFATRAEKENVEKEAEATPTTEVNIESEGSEKYVPKVIIDAKWGDGSAEFGFNVHSSPPSGPGNLVINENEEIFIYDCVNDRIYHYNSSGRFIKSISLENKNVNNFTVRHDTIFAVTSQLTPSEVKQELKLIDVATGQDIKDMKFPFSVSDRILKIKNKNGNVLISKETLLIVNEEPKIKEEVFKLTDFSGNGKDVTLSSQEVEKEKEKFRKLDKNKGELIVGSREFLISDPKGTTLLNAEQLAEDKNGKVYISVWSNNPLGTPSPRIFHEIFKFSSVGNKIAVINIPLSERVGETWMPIQISGQGDIYYLYPTGEVIQRGWEVKFIPGKVQVIKWELQR
jgi:hypothetical protein